MNHKPSIRRRPLVLRRAASGYGGQAINPCPPKPWRRRNQPLTINHSLISHSPEETRGIAASLIEKLPGNAVIALYGELGSGKTCFVQGMAIALEIKQPVTSPSFTIVNEYIGIRPLYHIDLYRLRGPDEVLALGFDEYLETGGIIAIEWAERAGDLIPSGAMRLSFEIMPNPKERRIVISAPNSPYFIWPSGQTCR